MVAALRIGELSRRSGVSPELLRAWERRYGLLRPARSAGGLRLYSLEDVARVQAMRQHLAAGLAAAEAAALAAEEPAGASAGPAVAAAAARRQLAAALDRFDESEAHALFDRLVAILTVDTLLGEIVLPYLAELGERWECGDVSVAQEHYAANVLQGRLLGLARGWANGVGPLAVLACLPDEQHELGLISFGLALRARGWRIGYLGRDTPVDTLGRAAEALGPEIVVLATTTGKRVEAAAAELRELSGRYRVALGGAGARESDPADTGALHLRDGAVAEAEGVAALAQQPQALRDRWHEQETARRKGRSRRQAPNPEELQ